MKSKLSKSVLFGAAIALVLFFNGATRANASVYNAIRFETQPSDTGGPLATIVPAPQVELVDQFGNLVSTASDVISLFITVPGSATLSGNLNLPLLASRRSLVL
jgi:hypothetical protein